MRNGENMSEKILIANAREAWSQACIYCNKILDGYVTLQYKKNFVSMLHNSVELLLKQRMLDINDYRVVKIKKIDSNGEPAKDYYASYNLNDFFKTNRTKDKNGKSLYYSIEFHEFHDLHKEIFQSYYDNDQTCISIISSSLTLLEDLRNDETHFYINSIDFLNGSQFKQLATFMISFSRILDFYELLPTYSNSVTNKNNVTNKIKPNFSLPERSDYRLFLKKNTDLIKIANYLNGKASRGKCDAFDIVDFLWFNTSFDTSDLNCSYSDAISLLTGAVQYNLVKIKSKSEKNDDGTINKYDIYEFNFK